MSETTERQAQMFSLVEECHQGILTRKEFCKHHSISHNCFYYWQKPYEATQVGMVEGYQAYDAFENKQDITLLACMAHVRRKFDESLKNDRLRAEYALGTIQQQYETEQEARKLKMGPEERKALRQQQSVTVLEELHGWLNDQIIQVLPRSAIGIAMAYTLRLTKNY